MRNGWSFPEFFVTLLTNSSITHQDKYRVPMILMDAFGQHTG